MDKFDYPWLCRWINWTSGNYCNIHACVYLSTHPSALPSACASKHAFILHVAACHILFKTVNVFLKFLPFRLHSLPHLLLNLRIVVLTLDLPLHAYSSEYSWIFYILYEINFPFIWLVLSPFLSYAQCQDVAVLQLTSEYSAFRIDAIYLELQNAKGKRDMLRLMRPMLSTASIHILAHLFFYSQAHPEPPSHTLGKELICVHHYKSPHIASMESTNSPVPCGPMHEQSSPDDNWWQQPSKNLPILRLTNCIENEWCPSDYPENKDRRRGKPEAALGRLGW